MPIVLSIQIDFIKYFEELDIQGIILTGGNDLFCVSKNELSKKRDIFEMKLIEYAITNKIPVLGVCRGMQIIAEYFGGKLEEVQGQVGVRHTLSVNDKSKYAFELKRISEVNSYHNYSVNKVPEHFIVSATNENGMLKAIESKRHNIFGQMWHSERDFPFDKNQLNLIKKVLKIR